MGGAVIPIERMLAVTAKVLCSGVFVSRRGPEEAFANSAPSALHALQLPEVLRETVEWDVDRDARSATVSLDMTSGVAMLLVESYRAVFPEFEADWAAETRRLGGLGKITREARHTGDQGAMIVPENGELNLHFEPVRLERGPQPGAGWLPETMMGPAPDGGTARRTAEAVRAAFAQEEACHASILVVRQGHILAEGYGPGLNADMPLECWSMGKSVMSLLTGVLAERGVLDLDAPAPVEAWQGRGDPRREITPRHLLNMSSGLRCTGYQEPRADWPRSMADHFHPYTEAIDAADFALNRPLEHAPGVNGRYRNCDTLALAAIFEERVRNALGGNPQSFPQTALFTPAGLHGLTHETDRWGRFIISGFNYGTARDLARLGQLCLNGGAWEGGRILPAGWVDFMRTPAPAWAAGNYGGHIWLNTDGEYPLPKDAYFMAGGGGQFVFIVPSLDLIVVRQGHSRGWEGAKPRVKELLRAILGALGATE